jgi:hypothetical protein
VLEIVQAFFVAVAGIAAAYSVWEARNERRDARRQAAFDEKMRDLRGLSDRILELHERAVEYEAGLPGGALFKSAQGRLLSAVSLSSVYVDERVLDLVDHPPDRVGPGTSEALMAVSDAYDELARSGP